MSTLDNRSSIRQVDPSNTLSHILDIGEQLNQGYALATDFRISAVYAQAKNILFLANGENLPVALALETLMRGYSRVPVLVHNDYVLPHWVSNDTLVIAIDYAGSSEAIISAFRSCAERRARLLAVAIDGELLSEARRYKGTTFMLEYGATPSAAFPYMMACLAGILKKLDFIEFKEAMITETAVLCRALLDNIGPDVPYYQNNAKQLAEKILNRRTIIVGSSPLNSVAERWQMVFGMTGKAVVAATTLSTFSATIVNGVGVSLKAADIPLIVMLQSKYDHQRNKLLQTLTYQIAQTQKVMYEQIFMHPSGTLFGEIILASLLGDIVGYYLAVLQGRDPAQAEATQFIRQKLRQEYDE